uniref:Uncharacterized protein n=1 Tax=Chromera velia CCMP2878 TaxID=1169474 RepID=A0A0G4HE76_9ALVE|eukprot:Cvel_6519.t1-p1 / transcript=Cvel_6519.t1 / gene=Cvel_6519 / organism=Chromera_velia_CCMP2878 / gene_product=hypothetical protein / transcript_product=hypothetical protein / location=Cvel_scaffold320:77879-80514(+) / protein_length=264 / sequence_SO=supercontig / SO=protein_coding / is_pseudo=false
MESQHRLRVLKYLLFDYCSLMVFNIIWVFISITLYFLGTYRGCSSPDSCGIFQDHNCATLCEGIECKAIGRCKYYFAVCSGEPACEDIAASATNAFYDCGSDWNPAFETVADSDVCTLCGTVAAARRRMSLSVPDTEGASSRTEADLDFSDFLIKSLKLFRWSSGGDWRLQKGPRRMSDFLLKNETEREKERGWREAEWGGGGKMQVWIEEPEPEPEEGGDVWSRVLQDTTDNTTTTTTVAVEEDTGRTRVMRSAFYRSEDRQT